MKLLLLDGFDSTHWKAYTPCRTRNDAQLVDEIEALLQDSNFSNTMTDLLALAETALESESGPQLLKSNHKLCHEAIAGEGVYEFIKGRLRMYWFYGRERRVIIVAAVRVKKGQTTSADVKRFLLATKRQYVHANEQNTLRYL